MPFASYVLSVSAALTRMLLILSPPHSRIQKRFQKINESTLDTAINATGGI